MAETEQKNNNPEMINPPPLGPIKKRDAESSGGEIIYG